MAKDKKSKKNKVSRNGAGGKAAKKLKAVSNNPFVADVVAAALVATASALKDSKRARALANDARDELLKLSKTGSERGSALWEMALQIGRRSLEALNFDAPEKPSKPAPGSARKAKSTKKSKSASKSKAESTDKSASNAAKKKDAPAARKSRARGAAGRS